MKARTFGLMLISVAFLITPPIALNAQSSPYPNTPLGPGLRNNPAAVQYLQNYLIGLNNPRYDIPAGPTSFYGPQTTQAVSNLQQDLGIDNSSGPGFYGPKTIGAVSAGYWTGSLVSTNEGNQTLPQVPTIPNSTYQNGNPAYPSTPYNGGSSPTNPGTNGIVSQPISLLDFGGQVTNNLGLSTNSHGTCGCSNHNSPYYSSNGSMEDRLNTVYIVNSNEDGTVPKPIHLLLAPWTIISTPNTRIPVAYKDLPVTDTFNLSLDTCMIGKYIPNVALARGICLDYGPSSNPSLNVSVGSGAGEQICHETTMPLEGIISLLKVQDKSACQPALQTI